MLAALVRASLRYRGVVMALAVVLLVYGFFAVRAADLDIFPEFAARQVVVQTEAPGYATGQVETLVTAPLEALLGGLPGVRFLRSESISGLSIITMVFAEDTRVLENRQLVTERLFAAAAQLPAGAAAPVVVPLASSSATVRTIGIRSDTISHVELSELVRHAIVPRLISAAGVADVNVFGDARRTLRVEVDPGRMGRFGVTFDAVVDAIATSAAPAGLGVISTTNQDLAVELDGGGRPVDIARLAVRNDPSAPVSIGDVADVSFGVAPPIGAAQIMTEPGIVLMVIGQYRANTRTVSRNLEPILDELAARLAGEGVEIYPDLFVPARYIETSLKNITGHVMIGGLFVVIILYAFLFNVRTAFISAVAIPLSLTAATIVLLKSGINLNIMVLGGLAIALGEVVDDAIIDTENIFRRLRENRAAAAPRPAARVVFDASMEVRGSVVYATFIVMLAFIPLLTLGGVAGRLVAPLGITYILAIFASLVTALTVTPALSYWLLGGGRLDENDPPLLRRLIPVYRGALERLLRRPVSVVVGSLLLCAAGLALLPNTSSKFLPELREGHYIVHTASLPGTSLDESIRIGTALTRAFLEVPGVRSVSQWAGRAERGADTYGSHYSEYEVALAPLSGREQQRVLERLRAILNSYPGILFEANTFLTERIDETLTGYTAPLVINIYGSRLSDLDRVALDVATLLDDIDGTSGVTIRSTPGTPIVRVTPDTAMLEQLGIAPASVVQLLQGAYDGVEAAQTVLDGRMVGVVATLPEAARHSIRALAGLPLATRDGDRVSLGDVAAIEQVGGRYNILRQGGQRLQAVTGGIIGRGLDDVLKEVRRRLLTDVALPAGMSIEVAGAAIEQAAARRQLIADALIAGVGIMLLIFVAVGRLRNVFLILLNLPFSLVGGVLAVLMTGSVLSLGSVVGFVTLFGITVRNTIMLVSHYQYLVDSEHADWSPATAIRGAVERLPSILMTALVTALAMAPIALDSDNPGREIMGPMAAIIIGGLVSSTVLNLLVMPVVMHRWGDFKARNVHLDDAAG